MKNCWIDLRRASAAFGLACIASLVGGAAGAAPLIRIGKLVSTSPADPPPTDAFCRANFGGPCYSPQEIRNAYGLTSMIDAGFTGVGQTIVIIDSFGSPTIQADLQAFDQGYGLPDPPSFTVLSPLGTVPFDPNVNHQASWAFETTLDVEWAHAIAPGASIVLLTSPVDETEGVQGLPEFLFLEKYALEHHLGKVISQSWLATENTLFTPGGRQVMADFTEFYERARRERVTVFCGAGDWGSTGFELDLATLYPYPVVGFPASSPLVTAVGGTTLFADTSGNYQYETVWNDYSTFGFAVGGGGGVSQVFSMPEYQERWLSAQTQATLAGHRGIPDVSYLADGATPILVYVSFFGPAAAGYYPVGGTSEGSPQWAGIVADLNQFAEHPLGFLNSKLYALGGRGRIYDFFNDITIGNNSIIGVPGYNASPGWDLATGWGTPDLTRIPSRWSELFDDE
jgi:subtilase family serine protease